MFVLITGTSSGIGHALARGYLENGHRVYGVSRNHSEDLEKFPEFHFLEQDISEFEKVKVNMASLLQGVEQIDLVILNAGILPEIKDLGETTLEEIRRIMDVNVWANKIIIDALFESSRVVKQIVAISSGAAVSGSRGWNAYALSKATLNMLIDLYSEEQPNTHFTALAPGIINTGMQEYIRSLPEGNRFPVVKKLRHLYETSSMPEPGEEADKLIQAIETVKKLETGSYVDVRELNSD